MKASAKSAAFGSQPTIDVLLAVDVEGALSSGNLGANIYMIDTNGYAGSGAEGQDELVTTVGNGQTIVWSVTPVDPATNAAIVGFSGQAVPTNINPTQLPVQWGAPWQASTFIPGGTSGTEYQYTMTLQFGGPTGKTLSFDPFLKSTT